MQRMASGEDDDQEEKKHCEKYIGKHKMTFNIIADEEKP